MRIKKITLILHYVLFSFIALLPVGKLITGLFDYTFELISIPAFAIVIALLAICTVIFSIILKDPIYDRGFNVLLGFLTPLSLINTVVYIFEYIDVLVIVSCFICALCCFALTMMHGEKLLLKIVAIVLSALMVVPVGFIGFIALTFGRIGQNTVVKSVDSPDGTYYAEVIDSDQGALGGDTLVNVYEHKGINAILFRIEKKPQRVYFGEWGEFMDMEIYWKNNNCLVINSTDYEIQ